MEILKAKNLYFDKIEMMFKADDIIKRIIDNAEYYTNSGEYTLCLMPADCQECDIDVGYHFGYYIVNGKLYESILTNNYDELARLNEVAMSKRTMEQLRLF